MRYAPRMPTKPTTLFSAMLALTIAPPLTMAQDTSGAAARPATEPTTEPTTENDLGVDAELSFDAPAQPFGLEGQQYWSVRTGVGFEFESDDDATGINLSLAYHHFVTDNFEVIGDLGGWYHAQEGDDAGSINPGFTLRYHLVNRDRWSLYADGGMGLLFSTDEVPEGGTTLNFMPHLGGGATFRLTDSGARLFVGARWHHISNARFEGDSSNPDRDGVFLYTGVMWPF